MASGFFSIPSTKDTTVIFRLNLKKNVKETRCVDTITQSHARATGVFVYMLFMFISDVSSPFLTFNFCSPHFGIYTYDDIKA